MSHPLKNLYHSDPVAWAVKTNNKHPKLSLMINLLIAEHAFHSMDRRNQDVAELRVHDNELIALAKGECVYDECATLKQHAWERQAYAEYCYEEMALLKEEEIERKAQSHAGAEELSQRL